MEKKTKKKFIIARVTEDFQKRFYAKCKELGKEASAVLVELAERFTGKQ